MTSRKKRDIKTTPPSSKSSNRKERKVEENEVSIPSIAPFSEARLCTFCEERLIARLHQGARDYVCCLPCEMAVNALPSNSLGDAIIQMDIHSADYSRNCGKVVSNVTTYHSCAWTFQDLLLSRPMLFITEHRVYFIGVLQIAQKPSHRSNPTKDFNSTLAMSISIYNGIELSEDIVGLLWSVLPQ
jgi:hypothetical protein